MTVDRDTLLIVDRDPDFAAELKNLLELRMGEGAPKIETYVAKNFSDTMKDLRNRMGDLLAIISAGSFTSGSSNLEEGKKLLDEARESGVPHIYLLSGGVNLNETPSDIPAFGKPNDVEALLNRLKVDLPA